jgi:hypothetical protein
MQQVDTTKTLDEPTAFVFSQGGYPRVALLSAKGAARAFGGKILIIW